MNRLIRTGRIVMAAAALIGAGLGFSACGGDGSSMPGIRAADSGAQAEYVYVIPAGTGALLDDGERVEIIPAELTVQVGETIEITNDDDRGHVIGAFYVGAGETLRQTFTTAGELAGECSVHPSGSFRLIVTA